MKNKYKIKIKFYKFALNKIRKCSVHTSIYTLPVKFVAKFLDQIQVDTKVIKETKIHEILLGLSKELSLTSLGANKTC